MRKHKALLVRIGVVVLLMAVYQVVYTRFFLEKDLQQHSPIINLVRKVVDEHAEIVYVGESSNLTFRVDDLDKRRISEFVAEYYPSIKTRDITKEACHAGVYYQLLRNIPATSSVKTVVVTMNLRSFDAGWIYSNLETALQKSLVLLKDHPALYNRLMLSFKGYDIKSDAERERQFRDHLKSDKFLPEGSFSYRSAADWDYDLAMTGKKNAAGEYDKALTELACHYVKSYAFQIDTLHNPRILDFDRIVELAKSRNWNLVFNLLPENVTMLDSLVGDELLGMVKASRDVLVKRYSKNNVLVVDNLEKVSLEEFVDTNWTTEHYAEFGRKVVAHGVAQALKRFYPAAYHQPSFTTGKTTEFFNDGEGKTPWGQQQTLTTDQHFSGKYSSAIGRDEQYGLTFESSVRRLPDSLKVVHVELMLFQIAEVPDARLVIEVSGRKVEKHWMPVAINGLTDKTGTWQKIQYDCKLPRDFDEADLVKIFVYNPTAAMLYADDIRIRFEK